MIAADSRLLTYAEAAARIPKPNGGTMSVRFIADRVRAGELIAHEFSHNCKRISELDLCAFLAAQRTTDRKPKRK